MSMKLKKGFPKEGMIAKKGIRVWKVFTIIHEIVGGKVIGMVTVNTHTKANIGETMVADGYAYLDVRGGIGKGAIHAYSDTPEGIRGARFNVLCCGRYPDRYNVIAQMAIPKGARYWLGCFGEICAEKMYVKSLACSTVPHEEKGIFNCPKMVKTWYDETLLKILS